MPINKLLTNLVNVILVLEFIYQTVPRSNVCLYLDYDISIISTCVSVVDILIV